MKLLDPDEKYVFNNCQNTVIFGSHGTYNTVSDKIFEGCENRIQQLKEENEFLMKLIEKAYMK